MDKVKLGDAVDILDSRRIPVSSKERATREKIYPYYGAQGIVDYIDDYLFDGDYILVAEDGNNLKALNEPIVTWATGQFWVNNHAHILGDNGCSDIRFVYYYLMASDLRGLITGSAQPKLNQENLTSFVMELPSISKQRASSALLGNIDDKITNNQKLIKELEETARLIYNYWFTQFDFPDENGKPYRSSGGKMVWNEELKREIPEGWEVVPLSQHCSIVDCLHSKKPEFQFETKDSFLLQLENLVPNSMLNLRTKYYVSQHDYDVWTSRIELETNDMVITNAGRVGGMARIPNGIKTGMGRNMTGVRAVSIPPMFMYYFFQGAEMRRQIRANMDCGSFFNSLNVAGIKQLKLILPPKENRDLLFRFDKIVSPLRIYAERLQFENAELLDLRDWLLPVLMNGQVTVGE